MDENGGKPKKWRVGFLKWGMYDDVVNNAQKSV